MTSAVEVAATTSDTDNQDWKAPSPSTSRKLPGRQASGSSRGGVARSSAAGLSAGKSITREGRSSTSASPCPGTATATRMASTLTTPSAAATPTSRSALLKAILYMYVIVVS